MRYLLALLSSTLALSGSADTSQVQVLPFGEFAARDGRPGPGKTWKLTDAQGRALAAKLNATAAKTPLVIDYEHQTLQAEENGKPAPAAGWMKAFAWRDRQGLWATTDWTEAAKGYIAAREYLYISPVLRYDPATGDVVGLEMAALTNYPALLGMAAVEARLRAQLHPQEPTDMDLLKLLQALFNLPQATAEQMHSHITTLKAKAEQDAATATAAAALKTALTQLKTDLGLPTEGDITAPLAALKTKLNGGTGDAAGMEALRGMLATTQSELATLKASAQQRELDELLAAAIPTKFVPAMRAALEKLGKTDIAQLRAMVEAQPAMNAPLLDGQNGGKSPPPGDPNAELNATELGVCRAMGLTPEAYKKQKVAMAAANA
ncbi:phage protease [Vitreoscilla filiformis]|nr:phage protease [Vitreoscilla filiformis]